MDEANITITGGGRTFGASNVQVHFDFDADLPNGDLWAAFLRIEDAYPLDEGEKLVARVLGHEYVVSGADARCSCGRMVSGSKEFYRHAREAIEGAEAELP